MDLGLPLAVLAAIEASAMAAGPQFGQGPQGAENRMVRIQDKGLVVDTGADASAAEKRVAELFADIVRERAGIALGEAAAAPAHRLVIGTPKTSRRIKAYCESAAGRPAPGDGGYRISVSAGRPEIYVAGGDACGVVAGVGRLLRMMRFEKGRVSAAPAELAETPRMSDRGMYLWARPTYFTPQLADRVDRYIEEFALWGGNSIALWFEMGMFSRFDDKAARAWLAQYLRHLATARRIGMKVGLFIVVNDAYGSSPKELRISPIIGSPAHYICPSKPAGARQLLAWQEQLIGAFPSLDALILWPADPGGCACADCTPWATKGFWRAAKPLGELFRARFPKAEIWLSLWHIQAKQFGGESWQQIVTDLAKDRPEWLTGLQPGIAPYHGLARIDLAGQKVLADARLPLTVFPEVSMHGNHRGMLVNKAYWGQMRAEMAHYPAELMKGGWPYSERWNTDIANVAFLCWFREPQRKVDAILDEYAAWYFGPAALAARRLLDLLDDGNRDADRPTRIQEALAALNGDLPEWARRDWRWQEIIASCARFGAKVPAGSNGR